jgi:hypothetical protein
VVTGHEQREDAEWVILALTVRVSLLPEVE